MGERNKTIAIIGAGPSGLTAAYWILKTCEGYKPVVIEAEGQVGGISKTVNYKGNRIDIGGHRFFSKNKLVRDIWHEVLPIQTHAAIDDKILGTEKEFSKDGEADPEKSDLVMLIRNRISRIFAFGKFFNYPISIEPSTFINLGLKRTIHASFSYLAACFNKKEPVSLEDFYKKRFGSVLYRTFFEKYTEKVWGVHPSQLSASWGAQRVKELSIIKLLSEAVKKVLFKNFKTNSTSLIESFEYPKFGPGELYEEMARRIKDLGGEILTNSAVTGLRVGEHGIEAVLINDAEIKCDAVFSSMPIAELIEILPATQDIKDIATSLPYRDFITVGLLLKKLKIKNKTKIKTISEIVPDNWIYIQEDKVKLGRLQIFNNWSPYMVKDFKETVWIGLEYFCNEGDELWSKSEEDFVTFAKEELTKIGIINKEDVLDATVIKVKKAYPAYFGSYEKIDVVKDYLNSISNLYCIGRNGQHRYNNMDHSMLTAIEAVRLLVSDKKDKTSLWNVNTEQSYHEGNN